MSISGLVVTLVEDADRADSALAAIGADPRLHLGVQSGRRVALVAETDSVAADRAVVDDLLGTPGVVSADIVFVDLEEPPAIPPSGPPPSILGDRSP